MAHWGGPSVREIHFELASGPAMAALGEVRAIPTLIHAGRLWKDVARTRLLPTAGSSLAVSGGPGDPPTARGLLAAYEAGHTQPPPPASQLPTAVETAV